jgi:cytochrome c553
MKKLSKFGLAAGFLIIGVVGLIGNFSITSGLAQSQQQGEIKMPEVIVLGKDAKLGQITFNHVKHNGGTYSIDETGPIRCIECHHTAQPASEVAKHPPLKTSWPADRTASLTAELFAKGSAAAGVAACRDCHTRVGQVPKLIPAIPEIKHEASTALITLTNQQAFHRNCAGCHTEIAKTKKGLKGPTTMQCMLCHKKAA